MQKYANLVELEKCCQTHIYLQKVVSIQPKTSPPNNFKKNCKMLLIFRIRLLSSLGREGLALAGAPPAESALSGAGKGAAEPAAGCACRVVEALKTKEANEMMDCIMNILFGFGDFRRR